MSHNEKNIKKLFWDKARNYEIPSYQRAYSWEDEQLIQFLDDLREAQSQYYLGHFLFEKGDDDGRLLVVDGQQRLTTLVIFWSALRSVLDSRKKTGESVSLDLDDITDFCLEDLRTGKQRFQTVREDNNFFRDVVLGGQTRSPTRTSQQRIQAAFIFFLGELRKTGTSELIRWNELVLGADITEHVITDKIKATQIFAFQNDRGKSLTKLEIIKAYFMMRIYLADREASAKGDAIRYVENEISRMYSQSMRIKRSSEDEILGYFWRSYSGRGFNSGEPVQEIKKTLSGLSGDAIEWIQRFMRHLAEAFDVVEAIEQSKEPHIIDLFYLNNLALSYPFILSAHRLGANDNLKERLYWILENVTFRFLVRGGRADITTRLNKHLTALNSLEGLESAISGIISDLKDDWDWRYWGDEAIRSALDGWFYRNRVDNYVLWKYELYIASKNHPRPHNIGYDDLIRNESIEHIAPQIQNDEGPDVSGYGPYVDSDNPSEGIASGEWLNCLGNLMLIAQSQNSSLGNKPFGEKLEVYARDNLLNQQKEIRTFLDPSERQIWNVAAIGRRHEKILKAALEIWSLDREPGSTEEKKTSENAVSV